MTGTGLSTGVTIRVAAISVVAIRAMGDDRWRSGASFASRDRRHRGSVNRPARRVGNFGGRMLTEANDMRAAIDTLKFAHQLEATGTPRPQAEGLATVLNEHLREFIDRNSTAR